MCRPECRRRRDDGPQDGAFLLDGPGKITFSQQGGLQRCLKGRGGQPFSLVSRNLDSLADQNSYKKDLEFFYKPEFMEGELAFNNGFALAL
jgi:hypothetical protein